MHRDGRLRIVQGLAFLCVLVSATELAAGDVRRVKAVAFRPLSDSDARVAEFARQGAVVRLRSPECQQVLGDFRDTHGRTLMENLGAFGVAADEYLAMLPLLDGANRPLCQARQSQLLTTAGDARVFVCKPFFETVQARRAMAEVYVIHEMLHTLGLGENPPSSLEITQQVVRRCAR
jgi:hypothetical protein